MATTQQPLSVGKITGPSKVAIFTNATSDQIQPFLVIANDGAAIAEVIVSIDDTANEVELDTKKIAGGVGKSWRVLSLADTRIGANDIINIDVISGSINYYLSGIIFDDSV